MKTLLIAEPGGTHDGRFMNMLRLIDVAAECGASVYKSQWVSHAQTMCDRRHAPEYLESYLKLQYPLGWHAELRVYAKARGLQYACTAYIPGDPTLLAPCVDYLKLSSFEACDAGLYREALLAKPTTIPLDHGHIMSGVHVAPVIVSAGMQDDGRREYRIWERKQSYAPMAVLHCVSSYPAPLSSLNLSLCSGNGQYDGEPRFGGFSDHSHDVRVGAWAVAAGATILETHFRLDDCDPANKDYAVAFTPTEFKTYCQNVRDCEAALGDGVKCVQPAEEHMLRYRVTG